MGIPFCLHFVKPKCNMLPNFKLINSMNSKKLSILFRTDKNAFLYLQPHKRRGYVYFYFSRFHILFSNTNYKYIQSEHDLIATVKNILFKNYLIQIGLSKYLSLLLFKHDFIITITYFLNSFCKMSSRKIK